MVNEHTIQRMLAKETPLTAAEAAKRCGVSIDAFIRWIRRGKPQRGKARLHLEGYQAGRSWMTTVEALARFLAASPRTIDSRIIDPLSGDGGLDKYESARRARAARFANKQHRRQLAGAR